MSVMRVSVLLVLLLSASLLMVLVQCDESNFSSSFDAGASGVVDGGYVMAELTDHQLTPSSSSPSPPSPSFSNEIDSDSLISSSLLELSESVEVEHLMLDHHHISVESGITSSSTAAAAAFYRFARTSRRQYPSTHVMAEAFITFKENMKIANQLNEGSRSSAEFTVSGPMADIPAAKFRSLLNSKNPKGKDKGKKVIIKAGRGAGKSGKVGGLGGKTAKQTGGKAKKSGKIGGDAGQVAKASGRKSRKSGKIGGDAGEVAKASGRKSKKSGKIGGDAGEVAKASGRKSKKSGKIGGDAGEIAKESGRKSKKSGKIGGDTDHVKQSGKIGGAKKKTKLRHNKTDKYGGLPTKPSEKNKLNPIGKDFQSKLLHHRSTSASALKKMTPDAIKKIMKDSGLTDQEIEAAFHSVKGASSTAWPMYVDPKTSLPAYFTNFQTTECGSCYSIVATNAVQRLWMNSGHRGDISLQPVLDCVKTEDTNGCNGGSPMDALDYFARNFIAFRQDYPVTMKAGKCKLGPFPNSPKTLVTAGWSMLIPSCTDDSGPCHMQIQYESLVAKWIDARPTTMPIAYVDASKWQLYKGGVFDYTMCKSTMEAGNHVVTISGYGTDANGVPYWIVENSWGVEWGENAKIRLPFGVNACGLFNFIIIARSQKSLLNYRDQTVQGRFGLGRDDAKSQILGNTNRLIDNAKEYDKSFSISAANMAAALFASKGDKAGLAKANEAAAIEAQQRGVNPEQEAQQRKVAEAVMGDAKLASNNQPVFTTAADMAAQILRERAVALAKAKFVQDHSGVNIVK